MAMEEKEHMKEEPTDNSGTQPASGGQEEESASRMDAAKAFFRALHAGGETAAPDFGKSENEHSGGRGPCPSCQRFEAALGEAEQKAAEADSLYRRMAADFDNYRRRIDREREDFQAAGIQKAVEAMLPALDDMDRAQMSLNPDLPTEKVIESLSLVFSRITRCLEQMGVKPLSVVGVHFDPKFHEPVQEIPTSEYPDGVVMQELRRGYTFNDRVIRPALVNVASNTGEVASQTPDETPNAAAFDSSASEPKVYALSDFDDAADNQQSDALGDPS